MKDKKQSNNEDLLWLNAMDIKGLTIKEISEKIKYYNIPKLSKFLKENHRAYTKRRNKKWLMKFSPIFLFSLWLY